MTATPHGHLAPARCSGCQTAPCTCPSVLRSGPPPCHRPRCWPHWGASVVGPLAAPRAGGVCPLDPQHRGAWLCAGGSWGPQRLPTPLARGVPHVEGASSSPLRASHCPAGRERVAGEGPQRDPGAGATAPGLGRQLRSRWTGGAGRGPWGAGGAAPGAARLGGHGAGSTPRSPPDQHLGATRGLPPSDAARRAPTA